MQVVAGRNLSSTAPLFTAIVLTVINFLNFYINALNYVHCWPFSISYNAVLMHHSDGTMKHVAQGDNIEQVVSEEV